MDDLSKLSDQDDRDIALRLDVFAEVELSPSVAETTRMRTAVMNAAHRRAALLEADRTFDAAESTWAARQSVSEVVPPATSFWETWRRPLAAVLAGCLTLAILAGTAWSARAGGPLYGARLWTEMANLPGDIIARADAEVQRLEARIEEAEQASSAGDGPGTEAALDAYMRIAAEAARSTAGNAEASAAIGSTVEGNVIALAAIADTAPSPTARAAAHDALMESDRILDDLSGSRPTD